MSRKHSPKFARFALFYTHYVHAGVRVHPKVLMRVNVSSDFAVTVFLKLR